MIPRSEYENYREDQLDTDTSATDESWICNLKERKQHSTVVFNKICNIFFQIWFFLKMMKC